MGKDSSKNAVSGKGSKSSGPIIMSFGVEIETVLQPQFKNIEKKLCSGEDVLGYLKKKYKFDESIYNAKKATKSEIEQQRTVNRNAMMKIVRDILKKDGIQCNVDTAETAQDWYDYRVLNIVNDNSINESKKTYYGMELVSGIFITQDLSDCKKYFATLFNSIKSCFNIIDCDTCATHIHARPYHQRYTLEQIKNGGKAMTIYEVASFQRLPPHRWPDQTQYAGANTRRVDSELSEWMEFSIEKEDFNANVFKHIDQYTSMDDLVDFLCAEDWPAFNFRPVVDNMDIDQCKGTIEFKQGTQSTNVEHVLHWIAEKVSCAYFFATTDKFDGNKKYTKEADAEKYGKMIRENAKILNMDKWLIGFGEATSSKSASKGNEKERRSRSKSPKSDQHRKGKGTDSSSRSSPEQKSSKTKTSTSEHQSSKTEHKSSKTKSSTSGTDPSSSSKTKVSTSKHKLSSSPEEKGKDQRHHRHH